MNARAYLLGAFAALLIATSAAAWENLPDPSLERARGALERGDLAEAERVIKLVDNDAVDQNDIDFLRGTLAAAKNEFDSAIAHFRAILDRDAKLNRVRLDLARVYFAQGNDAAAEFHFRAALAQGVPAEAQPRIFWFLEQIRRRKVLDINVAVAVAPDTNINAATTAQTVNMFGLPFDLDSNARKKSGTGVVLGASVTRQWPIDDDIRLKIGASYYSMEYGNSSFSDRAVSGVAGPRFIVTEGSEFAVLATAVQRWYGGKSLHFGAGGRIEGQTEMSKRTILTGAIGIQHFEYRKPTYDAYTGPVYSANSSLAYVLDAVSFIRTSIGVAYERARVPAFRNEQYFISGGYYREALPGAFALHADVQVTRVRYKAALPAFGIVRRDTEANYRIGFSNKRIDIFGFTPVLSWVHTDRYSNIGLYDFHRDRGEIGIARNF